MTKTGEPDTDELLHRVEHGDGEARNRLLNRHRQRLRDLVALRLSRRLLPRVDPSDVVLESLLEADRRLADYLQTRPAPFYVWLRGLALGRLIDAYRRHVRARRRSVKREEADVSLLPDDSLHQLADRLASRGSSPSARLQHSEQRQELSGALARLREADRDLLVLRHLEQLSVKEIAAVLGISEGAVKVRHVRALERLRQAMDQGPAEDHP
jgi:RNA polymerase sigma-70 factor (ECF subfamily)